MAIKQTKRKPIARPARKPTTPPSSKTQSTEGGKTETAKQAPSKANLVQRVARKPVVPAKKAPTKPVAKPKEVVMNVPKEEPKKKQSQPGASAEASKPVTTTERQSTQTESRPADKRAKSGEGRLSVEAMRLMTLEERYKLFRTLNKSVEEFVPIRKELPKKLEMRKDEAILRGIITEKAPKAPKAVDFVGYCGYCVDWQPFHQHSWSGYRKCCGCGITTKDFYIGIDNGIFGKE